ncbi:hypothetical protein MBT84_01425 [Streptomyces sp. MBT84]|uniref:hypothetical protein n=1 Tax=unclassified Streptomyces TaxID=2593676 RepID=UPI000A8E9085|nr:MULTISPECIES: hypothetical protein [unclassified Streptomyces]MBW8698224.1 hypothetical protein [Streptomyces sp. MBT84]MDX3262104.1 hypothetical protein [Streptomyces sp. MI02-2A]REE65847.1 hypothetical protein BX257_8604 [Streptomyces sp. 3212.3]
MLVVQGASVTAVVRGSTGEPVILLSGNGHRGVPEQALLEMVQAASAVLSEAELRVVSHAIPRLRAGRADSRVAVDGEVLTVYRLSGD